MKFKQIGTTFQCQCDDRDFDEYLVTSLLQWCAKTATGWHRAISSASEYDVKDFDDGLERAFKSWSVRIWFDNDAEAIAFRLVLDDFDAEVTC
jgi:hypothetical protein